jgi:hypothetical protein
MCFATKCNKTNRELQKLCIFLSKLRVIHPGIVLRVPPQKGSDMFFSILVPIRVSHFLNSFQSDTVKNEHKLILRRLMISTVIRL